MDTGAERRALIAGATGFVGGRLAVRLLGGGWRVRCLVRDRGRAADLEERGAELALGDVLDAESLQGTGEGVEVAYYLVHSMGRGGSRVRGARAPGRRQLRRRDDPRDGVPSIVYLGGLGERPGSKHLKSRHRTAEILAEKGPPLTYFRAAMVVGSASESYRTLRYLVQRLPAMIAPGWLKTPTQPIDVDDVVDYLASAPDVPASKGREVQIGGPDVLSYGEMLGRMADALGVWRRPQVPVPLLTPWLSSLWIGLVTPVDAAIARPLIEGLRTETVVTDPSGAAVFTITPRPFWSRFDARLPRTLTLHRAARESCHCCQTVSRRCRGPGPSVRPRPESCRSQRRAPLGCSSVTTWTPPPTATGASSPACHSERSGSPTPRTTSRLCCCMSR